MSSKKRSFDAVSEPVSDRVATGLQKIGLALRHQSVQKAGEDGISPTQGQILAMLSAGAATGTELAERLAVTLPTVSDSVKALAAKGLVEKGPDPRHPRATLLTLSDSGRKKARRAATWPDFLATAVSAMSAEEQEVFLVGLVKMIRSLQIDGRIPAQSMCVTCTHFRPNVRTGAEPHHCAFVDAPMAARHLRIVCDEHVPAAAPDDVWARFVAG